MHARLNYMLGGTTYHLLLNDLMPICKQVDLFATHAAHDISEDSAYVLASCKAYPVANI